MRYQLVINRIRELGLVLPVPGQMIVHMAITEAEARRLFTEVKESVIASFPHGPGINRQ